LTLKGKNENVCVIKDIVYFEGIGVHILDHLNAVLHVRCRSSRTTVFK